MSLNKLNMRPATASYTLTMPTSLVVGQIDAGPFRTRIDVRHNCVPLTVEWDTGPEGFAYLQQAMRFCEAQGGAHFLIDLVIDTHELAEYEAMFVPGSLSLASVSGLTYIVTAQILATPFNDVSSIWPDRCIPWTQVGPVPSVGTPVIIGSGSLCERDPTTGYIWTCWQSFGASSVLDPSYIVLAQVLSNPFTNVTNDVPEAFPWTQMGAIPIGGHTPLIGSYALVYDPITATLLNAVHLSDVPSQYWSITYFEGFIYIGIEGNTYSTGFVVNKIDAPTQTLLSQGDTDYLGAVSKLGLISHDRSNLHISITNGVGSGTAIMFRDAPFPLSGAESASNWYYNSVFNDFTQVRVYTGYGAFIDLRGTVNMSIDTTPYMEAIRLLQTRMLVKPCSPLVYLMDVNNAGIVAVDTSTGEVHVINATMRGRAMYYSPETDTLYIEGQDPVDTTTVLKSYDGSTFGARASHPTYVAGAEGNYGNSVYLGGEAFVAAEDRFAGSRLWRLRFPH